MMRTYRGRELVQAGKIQHIKFNAAGEPTMMTVSGAQVVVPNDILLRTPSLGIGDFLVKHSDGVMTVRPAAVFEAGYALLEESAAADPVEPPCDVEGSPV